MAATECRYAHTRRAQSASVLHATASEDSLRMSRAGAMEEWAVGLVDRVTGYGTCDMGYWIRSLHLETYRTRDSGI